VPDQEENFSSCPLWTVYATSESLKTDVRPFAALSRDTLERLYILRKWPIDAASNPIPIKLPGTVRQFHYDPFSRSITDTPLVVKEFQKQAILHLAKMPRFILGDAVGLGKTLDVLAAFAWLKARNPAAKMVVIATKSTTYQWADECEIFTTLRPKVMTDTYKGMKSSNARYAQMRDFLEGDDHDILIAKYDSLKGTRKWVVEDGERKRQKESEETTFYKNLIKEHRDKVVLALDECHRFRATKTQTRHFIMRLCWQGRPERVWALTATAIKNGLDEFYSIAVAIGVQPLGSITQFWEEYCLWSEKPIGQGRTIRLITGYQHVAHFKEQLRPFFLGRSQKQVKEPLPALTTVYHPIDLDEKQAKLLVEIPLGMIELPPIVFKVAGEVFSKDRNPENEMTQLSCQQLVANHWALLDRNNPETFLTTTLSPKEDALLDMLDGEYRGEKVVVYTKYRSWIDRLEWLTENGKFTERKFLRITGAESESQRNENKRRFQDPNSGYDLIVINAAGMEGINLQQAAHMVLLDCPWSWGDLIQLVGRMVRMASPHSACTLHIMVAKGTIDEYTIETLRGKKGVFEAVLGNSHSAGILDSGDSLDLQAGMEVAGSDAEFKALLRAYAKKIGMKTYLKGDQVVAAQDLEYLMPFEREAGPKKSRKKREQDNSWMF
jgi:SNF2 family DNA or RNA helicase